MLGLIDPTASWAADAVTGELQLGRVFRVQAMSVVPAMVDVVKFDVGPFMLELESVKESIAEYNAELDDYECSYTWSWVPVRRRWWTGRRSRR